MAAWTVAWLASIPRGLGPVSFAWSEAQRTGAIDNLMGLILAGLDVAWRFRRGALSVE
jgi:hypothetical protein